MQICIFNRNLCICYHKTHKTGISGRKTALTVRKRVVLRIVAVLRYLMPHRAAVPSVMVGRRPSCCLLCILLPAPDPGSCRTDDLLASCYPSSIHIGVFFSFLSFSVCISILLSISISNLIYISLIYIYIY